MILGIGVDIVEVSRIREAMNRPNFVHRILTPREILLSETALFVAGRWAAKEAVAKAVGTHLTWHDVEILPDGNGKPVATVSGLTTYCRIHVSISHERGHAVGMAILERLVEKDREQMYEL